MKYFTQIPSRVRSAFAKSKSPVAFEYEDEPFFTIYGAMHQLWVKRKSQRSVAESTDMDRQPLKKWEAAFAEYGAMGLLPELSFVDV
ncbi:MAG: hypothetical protein V2B19_33055, partial [Pseudomonadota bacterium]